MLIPFKIMSGNSLMDGNRKGKKKFQGGWKYRAYKEGFEKQWKKQALQVLPAENKRRLEITRIKGKYANPIDHDNLVLGIKPLIDVLVDYDALVNDNPKFLERAKPREEKSTDGKHYTRIRLIEYELNGEPST